MTTTNPTLLKMPLARDGDKTAIPETAGSTTGDFSQQYGFQEINQLPLGAGGIAPKRNDFNGVFNLLSGLGFFAQKGWTFHYDASQDYYLGCVVIDPADGKRYECIADMPAGTVAPHEDTDGDYWRRFTLGDGVPIATILAYSSNGDIPSGYLLCDGAAVSRTMFPDLFAAIGTTYGSGDGSTTFNLPDYNTAQRFAQGSTVAGTEIAAGLPDVEGKLNTWADTAVPSGAFSTGAESDIKVEYGTFYQGKRKYLNFNASASNPIYGNSTTVQPPALTTRYIIKAFDGQTADSALIDITQYANDLAKRLTREQTPAFNHRDVITTSGTYTAPVTGWYRITVKGGGGGGQGARPTSEVSTIHYYFPGSCGGEGGTSIGFEKLSAGNTISVVIGAGGTGGAVSPAYNTIAGAGTDGGDTTATVNGHTYTGGGGKSGGNTGYGGSGDIAGTNGSFPMLQASPTIGAYSSTYKIGNGYGRGGGGGMYNAVTHPNAGYDGDNGVCIIEYFDPSLM